MSRSARRKRKLAEISMDSENSDDDADASPRAKRARIGPKKEDVAFEAAIAAVPERDGFDLGAPTTSTVVEATLRAVLKLADKIEANKLPDEVRCQVGFATLVEDYDGKWRNIVAGRFLERFPESLAISRDEQEAFKNVKKFVSQPFGAIVESVCTVRGKKVAELERLATQKLNKLRNNVWSDLRCAVRRVQSQLETHVDDVTAAFKEAFKQHWTYETAQRKFQKNVDVAVENSYSILINDVHFKYVAPRDDEPERFRGSVIAYFKSEIDAVVEERFDAVFEEMQQQAYEDNSGRE